MSLINTAAELLMGQLGGTASNLDTAQVGSALSDLLPTQGGDIDLGALAGQFLQQGDGLAGLANSWLGDGANSPLGVDQLLKVLGNDSITAFAQQLGLNPDVAIEGLRKMIPALIDKGSNGGAINTDLLKNIGGSLLGKLF